jgi:hypothetical protein
LKWLRKGLSGDDRVVVVLEHDVNTCQDEVIIGQLVLVLGLQIRNESKAETLWATFINSAVRRFLPNINYWV